MKIIRRTEIDSLEEVFNLHVHKNHNYIVEGNVVSNCHGAKAAVIKELIDVHGKHISHRYGVTGTFPKSPADQYSLKCSIGQILREVPAAWLIEQGYLSKIEIEPVEMHDLADLPDYASERAYISTCDERIERIAQLVMDSRDAIGNTLVLVNSIPQGRHLQSMIPGSVFLSGESAKELRKENYSTFADQDGLIVIASMGIASTGISIDRIFCEILVDIGKSFVRCIQAVGRGLRKKGDKNYVIVKDVHTKLKFGKKHFKDRKKYYVEAGYPVLPVVKIKY
jgi:superfamily II DNA or RNA helicase